MRIGLFVTCLNDTFYPQTGQAVVGVLEKLGHKVEFPLEQTCCGQMHANSGYQTEAIPMVRRMVEVFSGYEVVVTPSGSCAAMVREQYQRLADLEGSDVLKDQVNDLASRTFEFAEFLVDVLGVDDVGAYYPHRVAYHPACHSLRALGVTDAARRLLENVDGIELVQHEEPEQCCGFGGTFAIKNSDTSTAMLSDKASRIVVSGAEVCTSLDNSCLMHIGGGLNRMEAGIRTAHLAEILVSTEDS